MIVLLFVLFVTLLTTATIGVEKLSSKYNTIKERDVERHLSFERTLMTNALYVSSLGFVYTLYVSLKSLLTITNVSWAAAINLVLPSIVLEFTIAAIEELFFLLEKKVSNRYFMSITKEESKVLSVVATILGIMVFLKSGEYTNALGLFLWNIFVPMCKYFLDWRREYRLKDTCTEDKPYERPKTSFEQVAPFFLVVNTFLVFILVVATCMDRYIGVAILAMTVSIILYIACTETTLLLKVKEFMTKVKRKYMQFYRFFKA